MEEEKSPRTIIQDIGAYEDYPFSGIHSQVLKAFNTAKANLAPGYAKTVPALLKAFECFFQISGRRLTLLNLSHQRFRILCEEFIGALYSERFIALTPHRRYSYAYTLKQLLTALQQQIPGLFAADFHLSSVGNTSFVQCCIARFEKIELRTDIVWLWHAWPSTNRSGRVTWFRLYPLYVRLGKDFTQHIYQACDEYYSSRKCHRVIAITELVKFIHCYPSDLTPQDFKQPQFATQFWRQFFMYYMKEGYASGVSVEVLITNWRAEFAHFVKEYLIGSGLFAESFGEFPCPAPRRVEGPRTHIRATKDGTEVKVKLLTHVPLQVTDSEAMELLFKQIQVDVDLITTWAAWATKEIWERHTRRLSLAAQGQARTIHASAANNGQKWLTSRSNPDHLKNAAATLLKHGYVTNKDLDTSNLFPTPLSQTAHELGLPTTGALLPHCISLVATHPAITPSFLENLELYDKNGIRVGLLETGSGYALNGRKARNGPNHSQQIIKLTEATATVVHQIIDLTEPIRTYLRARGDDNWRYLLLSCQQGFSYPRRIRRIATDTSLPDRLNALAQSLQNTAPHMSIGDRLEYAKRFSLPSLRASAAVLIYLKTRDAKRMSEALGHTEYSAKLLSRYLPDSVLTFFQERWIRIFQAGIIVEALKDSDYLLYASPFGSMAELDEFLQNHALKRLPTDAASCSTETALDSRSTEVIFGVNESVLTALISLQRAVRIANRQPSGKAIYWSGIADSLVGYLESESCRRNDLKEYLALAKRNAAPERMEALIYE